MKSLLAIIALAAAGLGAGYGLYYQIAVSPTRALVHRQDAAMEWLRQEFHLTPEQLNAVRRVDAEFAPQCQEMYRQMNQAYARTEQLIGANHEVTPAVEAALKECAHLQEECCRITLQHIYAVAAQLPPAEGDRYIHRLQPHILEPSVSRALASTHPTR